jgi:hypothetical protein
VSNNLGFKTIYTSSIRNKQHQDIPIWEKYTFTIEEAARYFRIGENRLRNIIQMYPDEDFIITVGNRVQIKRKLFERYIDNATTI